MKVILASTLGDSVKVNGEWVPSALMEDNGMVDRIKSYWKDDAKVLLFSAYPDDYEINDSVFYCFKEAFLMSGLPYASFELCDDRNEEIINRLGEMDAIILAGGHVPTENAFMQKLGLKEKLEGYQGLVMALSAGSMNSAELVYATPELEGEALDPEYQRWIPGLGLTKTNIFPHFQWLRGKMLDGLRMLEDIIYPDSMGHEIIALNDGSYILIDNGVETVYGEAYSIKDGCIQQICKTGESVVLGTQSN